METLITSLEKKGATDYIGKVRTKEQLVYVEVGWVRAVFLVKVFFFPAGFLFPAGLDPHLLAVRRGRRSVAGAAEREDSVHLQAGLDSITWTTLSTRFSRGTALS